MQDIDIQVQRDHTQILRKFILKTGVQSEEARTILINGKWVIQVS